MRSLLRFLLPLHLLLLVFLAILPSPTQSLTVHIVPHTHDDVGWLKTVDQYYVGLHNEIQHAMVQFILDSVVQELSKNPERRFMYVEQAFFQRWWRQQKDATRNLTRSLVLNGQLEFVNGGWCMHDEATTYYVDMIDQTTLGHRFIQQEFGDSALPTIGWQIDPFGHSSTQASLMSGALGFDALFFGRIDHQDHDYRIARKNLEFVWRASPSLGQSSQVFSGAFQSGNYGPPDGFCWDFFCGDDPVQDDRRLNDYNVDYLVGLFIRRAHEQAAGTAGDLSTMNIMWNMGSDFQHENSLEWMTNIDKIIAAVNANSSSSGVTALYSTPSAYLRAKNAEKTITWSVKTDDFFPYSDGPSGYWTGYFTSRPAFKRYVRFASNFLQIARQIEVFNGGDGTATESLWEAQSVSQHHDAVSGTAKQAVTYDYAQRIAKGAAVADDYIQSTLAAAITHQGGTRPAFSSCPLANVSVCPVSASSSNTVVLVYNPTGHVRREQVTVVVSDTNLGVSNDAQQFLTSQLVPVMPNAATPTAAAPYRLIFPVSLPSLSFQTFFVTSEASHSPHRHTRRGVTPEPTHTAVLVDAVDASPEQATFIENEVLRVDFSGDGLISNVTLKAVGATFPFAQDFAWYASYQNESLPGQLDGAYVFRPMQQWATAVSTTAALKVVKGTLVSEVWQTFAPWLTQIVRLRANSDVIELEWTIGPVPLDDRIGKNVVARYNSSLSSNRTFYTDANGREFQQRIRNYRPTWPWQHDQDVSSNYYPINAAAFLTDGKTAMVINNDRSQGGGSIVDGEMEILVHRRLISDDSKGVAEPLNEPGLDGKGLVITGLTTVAFAPLAQASVIARRQQNAIYSYLHQSFAPLTTSVADYLKTHDSSRVYSAGELPPGLELITLQVAPVAVNGSKALLRLSHSYGVGEGGQPISFDVQSLFAQPLKGMTELSLSAATVKKPNSGYVWKTQDVEGEEEEGEVEEVRQSGTTVTLGPLEVKTYGLTW